MDFVLMLLIPYMKITMTKMNPGVIYQMLFQYVTFYTYHIAILNFTDRLQYNVLTGIALFCRLSIAIWAISTLSTNRRTTMPSDNGETYLTNTRKRLENTCVYLYNVFSFNHAFYFSNDLRSNMNTGPNKWRKYIS